MGSTLFHFFEKRIVWPVAYIVYPVAYMSKVTLEVLSSNPASDRKKMKVTNSSELILGGVDSLSFFRKTHSSACSLYSLVCSLYELSDFGGLEFESRL